MSLFDVSPAEAGDARLEMDTTRVRLLVAYDGAGFHGFWPNDGVTTVGGDADRRPRAGAATGRSR